MPDVPDKPIRIFVSYNHEADTRWFEQEYFGERPLIPWLEHMLRSQAVQFWYDRKELGAGDAFRREIEEQIDHSDMAILLVSRGFMSSEFIQEVELPRIERRVQAGQMTVIPIITRDCPWQEIRLLHSVVVMPSKATPLIDHTVDEVPFLKVKDEILTAIERQVRKTREQRLVDTRRKEAEAGPADEDAPRSPERPETRPHPSRRWMTRNRALAATALIVVALLLALAMRARRPGEAVGGPESQSGVSSPGALVAGKTPRKHVPKPATRGKGDAIGDFLLAHTPQPVDTGEELRAMAESADGTKVNLTAPHVLMARESRLISLSPQSGIHVEMASLPVEASCGIVEVPMALIASLHRTTTPEASASGEETTWALELRSSDRFIVHGIDWPEVSPHLVGEGDLGKISFPFSELTSVKFQGGKCSPPAPSSGGSDEVPLSVITDEGVTFEARCRPSARFPFAIGDGKLSVSPEAIGEIAKLQQEGDHGATHTLTADGQTSLGVSQLDEWLTQPPTGGLRTDQCRTPMGTLYLSMSGWASIKGPGRSLPTGERADSATVTDTKGARVLIESPKLEHSYSTGMFMTYSKHANKLDFLPLDVGNSIHLLPLADLATVSRTEGEDGATYEAAMRDGKRVKGALPDLNGLNAFRLSGSLTGKLWCGTVTWPLGTIASVAFKGTPGEGPALELPAGIRATITFTDRERLRLDSVATCMWGEDGRVSPGNTIALLIGGGVTSVQLPSLAAIEDIKPDEEHAGAGSQVVGMAVTQDGSRSTAKLDLSGGPCLVGESAGTTLVAPFARVQSVKFTKQ